MNKCIKCGVPFCYQREEAFDKSKWEYSDTTPECYKHIDALIYALTKLEEYEKKNTPMKPIECRCPRCLENAKQGEHVAILDFGIKRCPVCDSVIDWSGDNKPLQNESGE